MPASFDAEQFDHLGDDPEYRGVLRWMQTKLRDYV